MNHILTAIKNLVQFFVKEYGTCINTLVQVINHILVEEGRDERVYMGEENITPSVIKQWEEDSIRLKDMMGLSSANINIRTNYVRPDVNAKPPVAAAIRELTRCGIGEAITAAESLLGVVKLVAQYNNMNDENTKKAMSILVEMALSHTYQEAVDTRFIEVSAYHFDEKCGGSWKGHTLDPSSWTCKVCGMKSKHLK